MTVKVIVVGAGPGGLISLANFQRHFDPSEIELVCYEKRTEVGGDWVDIIKEEPTPETEPKIHDWLQIHTPTVLYPPHPDHDFPAGTKLYPNRIDMFNYLKAMDDKTDLRQYIQMDKEVSDIRFDKNTSKFSMKVHDLRELEKDKDVTCDYVLLCNGHYGLPRKGNFDLDDFNGDVLYYHEFTDASKLYGKRVLVIGGSWAAMDVVIRLNKPGKAKSVHLSRRNTYPIFAGGAKLASMHPPMDTAKGNTIEFEDGTSCEVDAIVMCPGFKPIFPLGEELELDFDAMLMGRYLLPLYKHLVHPRCPKLFILGKGHLNALYLNHPQSMFIIKLIKGECQLPSEEEMAEDVQNFHANWLPELAQMNSMTEEEKDEYFPLAEMELAVGASYNELCPSVPKMGPDYIRELYYQFLWGIRNDCLNYKTYVNEFIPDPKNPNRKIPHLVPPK